MKNEQELLERARKYDDDALGELYDRYAPLIYRYLYRRVHEAQLAEDLTGDVFVRMLRAIRSQRFWHVSFRSWLYRIAHNLVVDHCRRKLPVPVVEEKLVAVMDEGLAAVHDSLDSVLVERLSRHSLQAAVSRLTSDQQHVVVLRFGEQLTAQEVAEVMDKSTGAVEALQHRALAALRRMLKED